MEEDEYYFMTGHNGLFMEDLTILSLDGKIDLYECRVCHTLTRDPQNHIEWHQK